MSVLAMGLMFLSGACAWAALVTYVMMIEGWRPLAVGSVVACVLAAMAMRAAA